MTLKMRLAFLAFAMLSLTLSPAMAQYYWGPPEVLNTTPPLESLPGGYPQIATDRAGTWVLVWQGGVSTEGITFSRSIDNGFTWSTPALLHSDFEIDTFSDSACEIATDTVGNWMVVWYKRDPFVVTDSDVYFSRSTDNGAIWSAPAPIHTNDSTTMDDFPKVASGGSGEWIVVWESQDSLGGTIGADWDILAARSTDNGVTWSAPQPVNDDAATDSNSDVLPDLASDGNGNWMVLWQFEVNAALYNLQASSSSTGLTWNPTVALASPPQAEIASHPAVASDGNGGWMASWVSPDSATGYRNVFTARSTDLGATWTAAALVNPFPGPTEEAYYTDVMSFGSGSWVVTWMARNSQVGQYGEDDDALISVSTDGGETWTALVPVNSNAGMDSVSDTVPRIATDLAGTWIAVWGSGGPSSVLMARGVVPVPTSSSTGWLLLSMGMAVAAVWRATRRRA